MPQSEEAVREIYVQPGESHLVSEPAVFSTVLGSCVGITFLIPRLGIGALCHPMLPGYPDPSLACLSIDAGRRYVDFAIRDIARQLDSLGARRAEAEVKLFGGGDVLAAINGSDRPTVGRLNSEAAFAILEDEGFNVRACRLRGTSGVHIQFSTVTGEVVVRRLEHNLASPETNARDKVHRFGAPQQ
jgi:chemotaxis protein CheD